MTTRAVSFTKIKLEGKCAAYNATFRNFPKTCPWYQWHSLLQEKGTHSLKQRSYSFTLSFKFNLFFSYPQTTTFLKAKIR